MTQSSPTALGRGLEDGVRYAKAHLADWARLGRIVRAHSAAEVVANVDRPFRRPGAAAESVAYWSGFAHGVQRVVRETANASNRNPG